MLRHHIICTLKKENDYSAVAPPNNIFRSDFFPKIEYFPFKYCLSSNDFGFLSAFLANLELLISKFSPSGQTMVGPRGVTEL